MNHFFFAKTVAAAVFLSSVTTALAVPIRYTFTGTVTQGSDIGQTVTGSFIFNPSTFTSNTTDGLTYQTGNAYYVPPYPSPTQVSGNASTASNSITLGGGNFFDYGESALARNFQAQLNEFYFYGQTQNCAATCAGSFMGLDVYDYAGSLSTLFADANSGISYAQTLNLADANAIFDIGSYTGNYFGSNNLLELAHYRMDVEVAHESFSFEDIGTLTSVTLSTEPFNVPEPATLALLSIAAAGLGWSRRKSSN